MKYVNLFQVISQIGPFIGSENSQRQTDQCPDVHSLKVSMVMVTNIVNLSMTIMASGDAIVGTGGHDLVEFHLAVSPTLIGKSRLEETTAATTAIIV